MLAQPRTRNAFRQLAENDNVPAAHRRLARIATVLAILGTSVALVLVHSVAAWFQPGWRNATALVRPAAAEGAPAPRHRVTMPAMDRPADAAGQPGR